MKLRNIQDQLRAILPLHTDKFNTWDSATYSVVAGVATVTTTLPHGLTTSDEVNIKDVVFQNPLTFLEAVNGTAQAQTQYTSDLTQGFQTEIEITGANEYQFNGTFSDIKIHDRIVFEYSVEKYFDGTATGSPVLNEKNLMRYNGLFAVNSVIDPNTFTVLVPNVADFSTTANYANKTSRIGVCYSFDDALNHYTEESEDDYWLFIVPEELVVSKQRETDTDFDAVIESPDDFWQRIQESISIICIAKANNVITPVDIMDYMSDDLLGALGLSLLGYQPDSPSANSNTFMTLSSATPFAYDNAIYAHVYTYSTTRTVTICDTFMPQSRAINEINYTYYDNNTNNKQIIAEDNAKFN